MLMKSLNGRSVVIGIGIENVMRLWTKTKFGISLMTCFIHKVALY